MTSETATRGVLQKKKKKKKIAKFTGKHLYQSLLFNNVLCLNLQLY